MTESGEVQPAAEREVPDLDVAALVERVERTLLGGARKYSRLEVAAAAGVPSDDANRLWRALGFATVGDDEVVFTEADVAALGRVRYFIDTTEIDDERLSAMTRMLGRTFARLASWQAEFLLEVMLSHPDIVDSEDNVAAFVEEMLPVLEHTQDYVWRRQLVAYLSRLSPHAAAEITPPGVAPMAVGFADMSNFTTLTRRASETELLELLEAFEAVATEVVGAHQGRIVKTIGDEILFVCDNPVDGAEIALGLLDACADDDRLPPLRIGLAAGPVVSRLGDVYGSTVNIANRLTSICRPGFVLVDRIMAESLQDDQRYSLKPRRTESVRGFHHLRQWRLRRAESAT